MAGVDDIIKAWVERVEASGELRGDPNFGKPFDLADGSEATPEAWRIAFRMLKNAGYGPPGMEMFKQLEARRSQLAAGGLNSEEATALRAEIAALEQRIALMKERFARG
jgi:hypothetical protein